jgi:hypothetical protein
MDFKRTFNNLVMIKLDSENDHIKLRNGFELYVDTTFEPEKHMTVTGTIYGLPSKLSYSGQPNIGMPWDTEMEVRYGDQVIVYYLAIINALKPENRRYVLEGEDRFVFVNYQNLFCVVREGRIIPINGYCLIEPCEDPSITADKERLSKIGIELIIGAKRRNTDVTYGIVRYVSVPNRGYVDEGHSDEGVNIAVGDMVVLKRTNDIPLQYNLHAKIDDGKLYWRVQRRNILARL